MPLYYPGTSYPVSHSFGNHATFNAEFDDSLLDQASWKNSRYEGARLVAKEINKFSDGDTSYQNLPVITNRTTALYIANTVVGGTEDDQFATIKGHSYVGINKILLIRPEDESVQIIDKQIEPWDEFHRFITNDFPAGAKARVKIIDESISTNLLPEYNVKMNKGWLLKSFDFQHAGETSGSEHFKGTCLVENNSMYLYRSGSIEINAFYTGSVMDDDDWTSLATVDDWGQNLKQNNQLRFRYGVIEGFSKNAGGSGTFRGSYLFPTESRGGINQFMCDRLGPSFASSSIVQNKFTEQYYSGSFGLIKHQTPSITWEGAIDSQDFHLSNTTEIFHVLGSTAFASASRFIGIDSLAFLASHNRSASAEENKTELHLTLFEGTKDFAPGFNDERSIGTFEIDENRAGLGLELGDHCNDRLPRNHEFMLKGPNDGRFMPTLDTHEDFIKTLIPTYTGSLEADATILPASASARYGCQQPGSGASSYFTLQDGINLDNINSIECFVQGGALGEVGFVGANSGSESDYAVTQLPNLTVDNFYSGSFRYEISFLDKDHTLIMDIDKDAELFDGIGEKGLVIIPEHSTPPVSFNVEYYLEKAGIINNTTNTTQNISPTTQTD